MTNLTLTLVEMAGVVFAAVALAATDAAALSRLAVAWVAKRAGLEPREVLAFDRATDGEADGDET